MLVRDEPNDATTDVTEGAASATPVVNSLSDPLPDATRAPQREHEQVVSEKALDEALAMTFPASDPVAL